MPIGRLGSGDGTPPSSQDDGHDNNSPPYRDENSRSRASGRQRSLRRTLLFRIRSVVCIVIWILFSLSVQFSQMIVTERNCLQPSRSTTVTTGRETILHCSTMLMSWFALIIMTMFNNALAASYVGRIGTMRGDQVERSMLSVVIILLISFAALVFFSFSNDLNLQIFPSLLIALMSILFFIIAVCYAHIAEPEPSQTTTEHGSTPLTAIQAPSIPGGHIHTPDPPSHRPLLFSSSGTNFTRPDQESDSENES
ncbi:hypothetical protein [Candidatus Similichlamydia epinepheli]|uniref:hypothetical protein n=1 Tax=Candidatus Similichlamydia epinepheli TaxID=1903953 RepID=UPI000D348F70|nr:hypothetical protein [Candidatus Similichlamydia epinepheli]